MIGLVLVGAVCGALFATTIRVEAMPTPSGITAWNQKFFDKKMALLDDLPSPAQDPLAGMVGDEQAALQGLMDLRTAALNHPPTGNEPDAALYADRYYNQLLPAIEYIRRWAGGGARGGSDGGY